MGRRGASDERPAGRGDPGANPRGGGPRRPPGRDGTGRLGARHGRRRRPEWGRLPGDRGSLRRVRRATGRRHAAGRVGHRRHRDRDGRLRVAPRRRDPVHGVHLPRLRSDRLPRGAAPDPLSRPVHGPARRPRPLRWRHPGPRAPLRVHGGVLRPPPGLESRHPEHALRREGDARERDPRPGPGHLPRTQEDLPCLPPGGPRGALHRPAR